MNHVILTELSNGDKLVKYNGKIDERLRKMIKYLEDDSYNEMKCYSRVPSWNKVRGTPYAVQIAAFISAYAKISINEFKNLHDNECIYSDTDSVVMQHKLPDNKIGKAIGEMKLEHEINQGVFPIKKLYKE